MLPPGYIIPDTWLLLLLLLPQLQSLPLLLLQL
jgi:hypothetical protein